MNIEIAWPINAIHVDGHTRIINNMEELASFRWSEYPAYSNLWSETHYGWNCYFYNGTWITEKIVVSRWILRDFFGRKVNRKVAENIPWKNHGKFAKKRNTRKNLIKHCMEKGLPIPGTGCWKAGYKQNAPAKKNSGKGHRRRNVARAIYEAAEYGIPNNLGYHVDRW